MTAFLLTDWQLPRTLPSKAWKRQHELERNRAAYRPSLPGCSALCGGRRVQRPEQVGYTHSEVVPGKYNCKTLSLPDTQSRYLNIGARSGGDARAQRLFESPPRLKMSPDGGDALAERA